MLEQEEKKRKESEAEKKRTRQRELSDIRAVLDKPAGRRFIWRLLSIAGITRSVFTQNAMQTAFLEGQRNLGLLLLEDINEAETHAFAQMQEEYISEQKSKKEARDSQPKQEE